MKGHRQVEQAALFYQFSLERHIPADQLFRSIDRFVDLEQVRQDLAPFYSSIGRPSIDPELMVRMLLVGYCYGIRDERRLCQEVALHLAYRWFCKLDSIGQKQTAARWHAQPRLVQGRQRESLQMRLVASSLRHHAARRQ
jgi:hypothetical protein